MRIVKEIHNEYGQTDAHEHLYAEVERARRLANLASKRLIDYQGYGYSPVWHATGNRNIIDMLEALSDAWDRYEKEVYAWYCHAVARNGLNICTIRYFSDGPYAEGEAYYEPMAMDVDHVPVPFPRFRFP